jgi:hypothetical protein
MIAEAKSDNSILSEQVQNRPTNQKRRQCEQTGRSILNRLAL